MTDLPAFFSGKFRRNFLAAVVVVALVTRGIIPAGYMPDTARATNQPFAMTMCSGMGPMAMSHDPAPEKSKDGQKLQDHVPCPFSVNAVFAFSGDGPAFAVPFIVFIILSAFSVFALSRLRHFGDAAPRAPPFCS